MNPLPGNRNILKTVFGSISNTINQIEINDKLELNIYQNLTVSDGIQSNNPWLQEMPDPISKVCWDNYLSINPKDATKLDIKSDPGTMTTNLIRVELIMSVMKYLELFNLVKRRNCWYCNGIW